MKYKKPARKRKKQAMTENDNDSMEKNNVDEIDELSCLLFFKTCILDRDIDILKIRLKQSIEMRESLIKKQKTEFHKTFPFYFIEPSLVSDLFF